LDTSRGSLILMALLVATFLTLHSVVYLDPDSSPHSDFSAPACEIRLTDPNPMNFLFATPLKEVEGEGSPNFPLPSFPRHRKNSIFKTPLSLSFSIGEIHVLARTFALFHNLTGPLPYTSFLLSELRFLSSSRDSSRTFRRVLPLAISRALFGRRWSLGPFRPFLLCSVCMRGTNLSL